MKVSTWCATCVHELTQLQDSIGRTSIHQLVARVSRCLVETKGGRTGDLFCRIPPGSVRLTLFRDETIFQIVLRTSASSTDIAFSRLFATCITHRVLCWAIADEMARLYVQYKFPGPVENGEVLTVLQILQIYPSGGFARSGQSVMKC